MAKGPKALQTFHRNADPVYTRSGEVRIYVVGQREQPICEFADRIISVSSEPVFDLKFGVAFNGGDHLAELNNNGIFEFLG